MLRDVGTDPLDQLPFQAVLGQFDPFDGSPNAELTTDASLYHPAGMVAFPTDDPARPFGLIVADRGNHRVLIFGPSGGAFDGAPADVVIGQPSFTSRVAGSALAPLELSRPEAVAVDLNLLPAQFRVFIADTGNGRVIQVSFGGSIFDITGVTELLTGLNEPCALHFEPGTGADVTEELGETPALYVVEREGGGSGGGAVRVVLFGNPQGTGGINSTATFDTVVTTGGEVDLRGPNAIAVIRADENNFSFQPLVFLCDAGNDRVLVFNSLTPTPDSLRAVLGADDLGGVRLTDDERRISRPSGLFIDRVSQSVQGSSPNEGARLVVADAGNHRLLFFPFRDFAFGTLGSAPPARDVLGQPGFFGRGANAGGRSEGSLFLDGVPGPAPHVGVSGTFINENGVGLKLFYCDPGNGRALGASGELDLIDVTGTQQGGES
jgi:hypothetical protein